MKKNTSVFSDDFFDEFGKQQTSTDKYASAGGVLFSDFRATEESRKQGVIEALMQGEKSDFIEKFNRDSFLKNLHKKHLEKK